MADPWSFMRLGARRSLFTELLCTKLIPKMIASGYEPRLDELKRTRATAVVYGYSAAECDELAELLDAKFPALAAAVRQVRSVKGIPTSVHIDGLAADIVLARGGLPIEAEAEYIPFGEFWETLHPLCRAGFRFGDACHFSITPDGVRK